MLTGKYHLHQCLKCFHTNPKSTALFIAPLTSQRVAIQCRFSQTGVDFSGPLLIHNNTRQIIHVKAYMFVLICSVTIVVHLELVLLLSTKVLIVLL